MGTNVEILRLDFFFFFVDFLKNIHFAKSV